MKIAFMVENSRKRDVYTIRKARYPRAVMNRKMDAKSACLILINPHTLSRNLSANPTAKHKANGRANTMRARSTHSSGFQSVCHDGGDDAKCSDTVCP